MDGMNERWDDEKRSVQESTRACLFIFLLGRERICSDTATPNWEMFTQLHMDMANNSKNKTKIICNHPEYSSGVPCLLITAAPVVVRGRCVPRFATSKDTCVLSRPMGSTCHRSFTLGPSMN